ncbi:MAG: hypothetical protein HPY53_09095 [Brevinematales bacterium]|nr:hypothetical protein [Brevinematales bacterium]
MKNRVFFMFSAVIAASLMLSFCSPGTTDTTNPSAATDFGPKFTVFVSAAGNDANFGTNKNAPIKSISNAIATASALGFTNIYIAAGTYTPGNGIMSAPYGVDIAVNNIHLIGGWNSTFTAISGYSVFDGNTQSYDHSLYIHGVKNISLSSIIFQNSTNDGTYPLINITKVNGLNIFNCICTNNISPYNDIIDLFYNTNVVLDHVNIIGNTSQSFIVSVSGSSNFVILSSMLYKNNTDPGLPLITFASSPYTRALVISNNIFGGKPGFSEAIAVLSWVSNHIFVNNSFVSGSLNYYYRFRTISTNDINAVNDTAFTKATISSGNKLTNF